MGVPRRQAGCAVSLLHMSFTCALFIMWCYSDCTFAEGSGFYHISMNSELLMAIGKSNLFLNKGGLRMEQRFSKKPNRPTGRFMLFCATLSCFA